MATWRTHCWKYLPREVYFLSHITYYCRWKHDGPSDSSLKGLIYTSIWQKLTMLLHDTNVKFSTVTCKYGILQYIFVWGSMGPLKGKLNIYISLWYWAFKPHIFPESVDTPRAKIMNKGPFLFSNFLFATIVSFILYLLCRNILRCRQVSPHHS